MTTSMDATLLDVLQTGLRPLADDGSLAAGDLPAFSAERLFVVDLEMSGPDPKQHEVLDVGGVIAALEPGLREITAYGARVRPLHIGTAQPAALKVVGYSSKAWRDAIELEKAFSAFTAAGEGSVIAGWGIAQDMAFLVEAYRRTETPWPFAPVALDIQLIARKLLQKSDVDRFNLGHVADRLGVGRLGEHGALADAYATYDVLLKLFDKSQTSSH